jgi:hypothetical protein
MLKCHDDQCEAMFQTKKARGRHYGARHPMNDAEADAIRADYATGRFRKIDLHNKYHRDWATITNLLGVKREYRKREYRKKPVASNAISPESYVLAFEERAVEFHRIIEELKQQLQNKDDKIKELAKGKNLMASLGTFLGKPLSR